MENILHLSNVTKNFGGLKAVSGLSFAVPRHSIKALIGPNGAGKTTVINMISGIFPPSEGDILFEEKSLLKLGCHKTSRRGLLRTFQNVRLFDNLSVLENVMVGYNRYLPGEFFTNIWPVANIKKAEEKGKEKALAVLDMVGLLPQAGQKAGEIPFGQQRLLELARAYIAGPKLLLLDEPAAGLSSFERKELTATIRKLRNDKITILIIEHDMDLIMSLADEIVVIDYGQKIAEGSPASIQTNPEVIRAYLGGEAI